jgi:uncharacterized membrane protein
MQTKSKRLGFIDAARGLAIILMLQGHCISLTFQDYTEMARATIYDGGSGNIFFDAWFILRGFTAPLFFSITGVVFTYLLLREKDKPFWSQIRVRKGLKRGAQVVLLGYLLQLNFQNLDYYMRGHINSSFFSFHVLPSIGVSLFVLIGLYALSRAIKRLQLYVVLFIAALIIIGFTPVIAALDDYYIPTWAPEIIQNMINGPHSVFPIFPWFGYVLLGGCVGALLQEHEEILQGKWTPLKYAGIGILFCVALMGAAHLFQYLVDPDINFATIGRRFGFFAVVMAVLVGMLYLERTGKVRIPFFVEMGKNTLNIYIIHSMILYGSFIGIGIKTFVNKSLTFPLAVIGAIAFILFFGLMTHLQNLVKELLRERKAARLAAKE